MGLQQGFAITEMGLTGQFALQKSRAADVCFGSKASFRALGPMSALPPIATVKATCPLVAHRCRP
jgi:hypothetical protein